MVAGRPELIMLGDSRQDSGQGWGERLREGAQSYRLTPRKLKIRYWLALAVLGAIALLGWWTVEMHLRSQEGDAATINMANYQKLLCMEIVRKAMALHMAGSPSTAQRLALELERDLRRWERIHRGLIFGDPKLGLKGHPPEQVMRLLRRLEPSRRTIVEAGHRLVFLVTAGRASPEEVGELVGTILAAEKGFLKVMREVVACYERLAQSRVERLRWISTWLAIVLLGVLGMVGVFIFLPTVRQLAADIRELSRIRSELERLSLYDPLTGIPNRRQFEINYNQEWRRAERGGYYLSVLMVDIDHFKLYNDTYGHQAGDHALKQVAEVVAAAATRPGDMAARYGGEEFVVVLPRTSPEGAKGVAERIRERVGELRIPHSSSPVEGWLTVSIGVGSVVPAGGMEPSRLVHRADQALYKAKARGRNRVEVLVGLE